MNVLDGSSNCRRALFDHGRSSAGIAARVSLFTRDTDRFCCSACLFIEVLKAGQFNHRLLSEMLCHKYFQRMMLDAEIYVDRIADKRINDMNAMLEAVRKMAMMNQDGQDDLSTRTLELAQVREDDYFGHVLADDLKAILRDIREEHSTDTTTADTPSIAEEVRAQLQDAMNFEGSDAEKQARIYLSTFVLTTMPLPRSSLSIC